ncbi:MAG: hypothetical protein ACUZ77_03260 [Candidatus Brocadiales bacterium]
MSETSTYSQEGMQTPRSAFVQSLPLHPPLYEQTSVGRCESHSSCTPYRLEEDASLRVDDDRYQLLGNEIKKVLDFLKKNILVPRSEISRDEVLYYYLSSCIHSTRSHSVQARVLGKGVPPDILAFLVRTHSIKSFFRTVDLVSSSFKQIISIDFRKEEDPEVEGISWICIDIETSAENDEILRGYDVFTKRFVAEIPAEARQYLRIAF